MLKNIITEQWQEAKELERTQKIYNTNSVKVYGSRKGGPSAANITNCIRLTWFMAHGYIEKDIVDTKESNSLNSSCMFLDVLKNFFFLYKLINLSF